MRFPGACTLSGAKGIADAEKDASREVVELVDGLPGDAAREVEVSDRALDPAVHRQGNLWCHGIGQARNGLPAQPDAFRIVDGRRGLGWNPEIVAPLNLRAAKTGADIGRNRESNSKS